METIASQNLGLNFYRKKKFGDRILLTTDYNEWVVLSNDEYVKMLKNQLDKKLTDILVKKGIIMTEDNIDLIIEKYARKYQLYFQGTVLHLIIPTTQCNHRCIYCHSNATRPGANQEVMDQKTADSILDFIFQSPAPEITIEFQGGEALLNFDMVEYISRRAREINKTKKRRLHIELVSNLTLLTDQIVNFIVDNDIEVSTSLDGPQHVHDMNRKLVGGGDTYKTVIKMMNRLQEKGIFVGAMMVTTRYSLPYWKEIVDEYLKWNKSTVRIQYLDYLGFAKKEWEEIGYSMEEFLEFWKKSVDYMFEQNSKGIYIVEGYLSIFLLKLYKRIDPNYLDLRSPCGIVNGQLAYNYNGDIYCCDEGREDEFYILGNTKKDRYKDILQSKKTAELVAASINENLLCDSCVYKSFCGVCPILSRAENNTLSPISVPNDKRCKMFRFMLDYLFDKVIFQPTAIRRLLVNVILQRLIKSAGHNPQTEIKQ